MYRWGTLSSHFTMNVFEVTCYMRTQGTISYPAAATCSIQHFVEPDLSEKGAKSCRENENVISNFWESFSHVLWLWIPRGFCFSSVFLWPFPNVDVLIIHTNVQFSFGSYWIPAGHQLWLIISWVTAEYAQMLVVRTVWPLASSTTTFHSLFQEITSKKPFLLDIPCSFVIIWNYKCIYLSKMIWWGSGFTLGAMEIQSTEQACSV